MVNKSTFILNTSTFILNYIRFHVDLKSVLYQLYIFSVCSGDFQFAVSSDDNSEFWLSSDENPLNSRLMAYVGKVSLMKMVCYWLQTCYIACMSAYLTSQNVNVEFNVLQVWLP